MKLVQFFTPELGPRLGSVQEDGKVFDLTAAQPSCASFNALLEWSGGDAAELQKLARQAEARVPDEIEFIYDWMELDRPPSATLPHLMIPLSPPEVWGFGVTYQRSAEVRDADVAATMDSSASIYDRVYHAERPECFFKATAPRCVGPNRPIGIRSDSELTATEPELAYVLGTNRQIVGYTICNDVSAWDLEVIIGMRVLLKLLAADPDNAFATFIYRFSRMLVWPFFGLIEEPVADGSVLELSSIIAMLVYLLVAWGITKLIYLVMMPSHVRQTRTVHRH